MRDPAARDASSWPHDLCNEEILARLLSLQLERAAAQRGAAAIEASRDDGDEA